jgi:DNA-binding response OmpR family regulator
MADDTSADRHLQAFGALAPENAAMRLLLIEDDLLIARELGLRWQARGWVVRSATTLADADAAFAETGFDLVILDLGLPDGDGLRWLVRLRERDPATPVMVVTARDRIDDRVQGLRSGADDYLVKPFAPEELDARVEVLMRRCQIAQGDSAHYGRITWLGHEGRAYVDGMPLELSPREFEVLGLLIRRAPRLLPKRMLIDLLAERNLDMHDSASEVYVSRLRRKLVGSGTVIRTLRGFGYSLALEPDSPAARSAEQTSAA